MKKPLITVDMWTNRFLGSAGKADSFLSMIESLDGGRFLPEKWSQFEPIRNAFKSENREQLRQLWVEERHGCVSNQMLFTRKKPNLFLSVKSWRGRVPNLNYLWFDLDAKDFADAEGVSRLKRILSVFVEWSGAVYATAQHSYQRHYRAPPGNPTKRLDRLNWLTFLGEPYLDFFGEELIQSCPFYSRERLAGGLLLTAAERPDSPSMCESGDVLLRLEQCLGADAFARDNYPDIPCRVPDFDLRETVNASEVNDLTSG